MPPTDPALREGHGRWVPIQKPAAGVLWVTDLGVVGFQPNPGVDPQAVEDFLDTAEDAGRDGNQAFDMLTALIGTAVLTGDLGHWKADRTTRPQVTDFPLMG